MKETVKIGYGVTLRESGVVTRDKVEALLDRAPRVKAQLADWVKYDTNGDLIPATLLAVMPCGAAELLAAVILEAEGVEMTVMIDDTRGGLSLFYAPAFPWEEQPKVTKAHLDKIFALYLPYVVMDEDARKPDYLEMGLL